MDKHQEEIAELAEEFRNCQKLLTALGDENRQHLILEMMQMGQCRGSEWVQLQRKPIYPGRRYRITSKS